MCGISALILADANGAACPDLFESLGLLQHRGQVTKAVVNPLSAVDLTNLLGCCWYRDLCC
jgi:glutamine phosphoribosylpyrophosphate amidotransferase